MHWRKTLVEKWNWLNCLQQVCAEEGSALISLPLLWGVERKALQSMKSKTLHGKLVHYGQFLYRYVFWNETEWVRHRRNHWDRVKGWIWRNQSAKKPPKAVNTRTSSWEQKIHPCLGLKSRTGNGRAGRLSHHRIYPADRSHFCFIITRQQQLENIQDWINYEFLKVRSWLGGGRNKLSLKENEQQPSAMTQKW